MTHTTRLAGQALAEALKTVAVHGLTPTTTPALQIADTLTTTALQQGATPEDIRRAAGLPT